MLRIEHLSKSFGGVKATSDVSMNFPSGSLSAVIGPNGAGKTTFFNLISGALQPDAGKILLEDENIVGLSSSEIIRKGIGRAFQVAKLFKTLTVEESLRGALQSPLGKSAQMHGSFPLAQTRDRAMEVMELWVCSTKLMWSVAICRMAIKNSWILHLLWCCGPRSCCSMSLWRVWVQRNEPR